jgi:hypothetical protein
MPPLFPLTATLLTATLSLAAAAQIPQPPPSTSSISVWPTAQSLKPGTHLLLTTTSAYAHPLPCQLDHIDFDQIACRSPHHAPPLLFDRNFISIIEQAPTPRLLLGPAYFAVTGSILLIGISCTAFSTPCAVVALAGILGAFVGVTVNFVSILAHIHHSPYPATIYIARP